MVRVRLLVPLAVAPEGGTARAYEKGDIVMWEKGDAQKLYKAGYAEPYPETVPETTTAKK